MLILAVMTQTENAVNVATTESPVPLEAVLSDELTRRPWREPDYKRENRALGALARALAESPREILRTFAQMILDVTESDSAGLSLLTIIDSEERFYWPAIAGVWQPHVGGGTPRHFGPCGDVLDADAPLLFRHPERRYPYLLPVMPPAVECLLVPFQVRGKSVGTVWAMAHDDRRRFDAEDLRLMRALGQFASAAYEVLLRLGEVTYPVHAGAAPPGAGGSGAAFANGRVRSAANKLSPRERECLALLVLARHPIDSIPHFDRPYSYVVQLLTHVGEAQRAKAILALYERDNAGLQRWNDPLLRHRMRGHIAFAEGSYGDALREYTDADVVSPCRICLAPFKAQAYDRIGQSNADSAIAQYTKLAETADFARIAPRRGIGYDADYLAVAYKRLGELWEQKGDGQRALTYYGKFVDLWKNADAELQPLVSDVRRRMSRLERAQPR